MKNLAKTYFEIFSRKDIYELSNLLADEIVLQDWDIHVEGKKQTLIAIKKIFDSVESIEVFLNNIYIVQNVAICLIEININKDVNLKVIDILKFNSENKIIEISAYKQ